MIPYESRKGTAEISVRSNRDNKVILDGARKDGPFTPEDRTRKRLKLPQAK